MKTTCQHTKEALVFIIVVECARRAKNSCAQSGAATLNLSQDKNTAGSHDNSVPGVSGTINSGVPLNSSEPLKKFYASKTSKPEQTGSKEAKIHNSAAVSQIETVPIIHSWICFPENP